MQKKLGRPKSENAKKQKIEIRVTEDFKKELQEFADKKGISVSSLLIMWSKERLEQEYSQELLKKQQMLFDVSPGTNLSLNKPNNPTE